VEGAFFAAEHKKLEIRTLYLNNYGEVQVDTTLQENESARPHAGFSLLTLGAANHHSLGAIKIEGIDECKYIFTPEEASKAEHLLGQEMKANANPSRRR
jgi:hypothetical protein